MKMAIRCCSIFGFLFLGAFATGDDLLSILESDSTESIVQERSDLTVALRGHLKSPSAEQNIFLGFLEQSDYEKALFQWWAAFEETPFVTSSTGQALFSYLLVKNKMPINGVENLFRVAEPQKILAELVKVIRLELPAENLAWTLSAVEWRPAWGKVFGSSIEVRVRAHQRTDITDVARTYELLKKTKVGSVERSWIEWQMVLGLALNGESKKSGKVLAHLLKAKNLPVDKGLLVITAARMLFEKGYLTPALAYYSKVPHSSEYWFVAQEEKAWTYIRKGEPQNTLATTKGLILPEFTAYVGPELLFLRALAELKVCNYPAVAETLSDFKKRFRKRVVNLSKVGEHGNTPAVQRLIGVLSLGKTSLTALKGDANFLPQFVSRDDLLMERVKTLNSLKTEEKQAGALYTRSLTGGSAEVGFQASLDQLRSHLSQRVQAQKSSIYKLIEERAADEVAHIRQILQKMHIVEAEVLQQISMAEQVAKNSSKTLDIKVGSTGSKSKAALRFPYDGEIWFDEITQYRIDIKKGCQAKR